MELDLQGRIERFTLAEVLQLVASGRKSGTLGVQKDDSIVMVYFKDGSVVYAYGPRQTYHLGELLRQRGIINAQQLEEAVRIQAETENSRRLGEVLISRRFIDRADLEAAVKGQIEELLYSLLSWQTGSFKFYENQFPTDEEITVDLSVENVILEGLRRLDEMNMINDTLPDLQQVYTISAAQGGRSRAVTMEADEWNIMALVNGHRTLEEVCRVSPADRTETLKRLAQLKLAGIITKTERARETTSSQLEDMVGRLSGLFEEYLTVRPAAPPTESRITKTYLESVE